MAGAGYLSVARIVFSKDAVCHNIAYEVQVLFTNVDSGIVQDPDHFMEICKTISDSSGYKFCPGLQIDHYYTHYYAVIRYHIKSVRLWEHPFKRIDSRNCLLWHELAANAAQLEKLSKNVLCKSCKRLCCDLDHQRTRSDVSPSKRAKRQLPSSNFKLKYLSPASVMKRRQATQQERSSDKA